MPGWVALLQGVNVGRHKRMAMADLRRIVAEAGGADPVTVANSGNVVFGHPATAEEGLRADLEERISAAVGQPVPVLLRSAPELAAVVADNPFPDAAADPTTLHVEFLLQEVPGVLEGLDHGGDQLHDHGRELYLFAPHKLSGATYDSRTLHRRLGSHHTSRNWNTVGKLLTLVTALPD